MNTIVLSPPSPELKISDWNSATKLLLSLNNLIPANVSSPSLELDEDIESLKEELDVSLVSDTVLSLDDDRLLNSEDSGDNELSLKVLSDEPLDSEDSLDSLDTELSSL